MSAKKEIPNFNYWANRYLAGESENKLAREIGVGRFCFRRHLVENGIAPRGQSESEAVKWSRMTPEQRKRQVKAAHDAVRGVPLTVDVKMRQAIGKERAKPNVSYAENLLAWYIDKQGFSVVQQKAIGIYNVDIAINELSIAVEIYGGGWHAYGRHIARYFKRTKYLLDSGWHVVIIWVDGRRYPLRREGADNVVSFLQEVCANPSISRQYWVILGDGSDAPIAENNLNGAALIERLGCSVNTAGRYDYIPR